MQVGLKKPAAAVQTMEKSCVTLEHLRVAQVPFVMNSAPQLLYKDRAYGFDGQVQTGMVHSHQTGSDV